MQLWSLQRKIQVTQTRIIEWYEKFNGNVYISFSGGKDSTVLLDLARRIYPDVKAVYIDTGLEYPEIRNFVKTIRNVEWCKPEMNFKQVLQKYGYPVVSKEQSAFISEYRHTKSDKLRRIRWFGNKYGRGKISKKWRFLIDAPFEISDKCCDIMKKNPAKKFEKETGLHPIIGTMTEESQQRKSNWLMYGCNSFSKARPTSQPMSFWTNQDVLKYIKLFNINYAAVYGDIIESNGQLNTTGCDRTGCMFCLYGIQCEKGKNRIQRLLKTHPKVWLFCLKPICYGGFGDGKGIKIFRNKILLRNGLNNIKKNDFILTCSG